MFFLLRMAFWLGLVLVLLPRAKTPEAEKLPQISVSDAVNAASAAVSDMSQFCKRQPQACEVGGQAATVIGARAQEGARKIYQTITDKADSKADRKPEADKKSPDHTGSIGGEDEADVSAEAAPRDTLTPDDLAVEWRGLP
jgi:F0F1-type ATP synthase membrane subunit b/b'